jgi:hypothetical protein
MTTKEKVVRQSIKKIENRLTKIQELLDFDYIKELKSLRNGFLSLSLSEQARTVKDHIKKEKKLESTFEKHLDSIKLIEEKVKLEFELADLNSELYWIENRRYKAVDTLLNNKK